MNGVLPEEHVIHEYPTLYKVEERWINGGGRPQWEIRSIHLTPEGAKAERLRQIAKDARLEKTSRNACRASWRVMPIALAI